MKADKTKRFPAFQLSGILFRSSHQMCSVKKDVLRNFAKFAGKYLSQSLFFNKVASLISATLLKKALAQMFSCEFYEIFKNNSLIEHIGATASVCLTFAQLKKMYAEIGTC